MGSVIRKERIPVGVRPPSLPCRSHLGRLGHVGHCVVRLGQLVLNPLKGAESVVWSRAAVASVSISFAPSLEKDWQCADIRLLHCLHKSQNIGEDVAVNILSSKAWSLALILQHNSVPVAVLDPVEAVARVPVERLSSRRAAFRRCGEAGALGNLTNHTVNSVTASRVAVAEEEDVLVGAVASGLALLWESRLGVRAGNSGVSVCGAG